LPKDFYGVNKSVSETERFFHYSREHCSCQGKWR